MKDAYEENGFMIIKGLITPEEHKKLKEAVESSQALQKYSYGVGDGADRKMRMCLLKHPGNNVIGMVSRCEKVAGTAEQILGGEVYHYHSKVIMKDARTGGKFVWHQDYGYWYNNFIVFPDMLSVLMPIDPSLKENGCLQVLVGSHKCGRINHGKIGGQTGADLKRLEMVKTFCPHKYVELQPGDALFQHSNLLHTSEPNNSDMRRWMFIVAYNKASNNPVKQHFLPSYTKLHKVKDSAILDCKNEDDLDDELFVDPKVDFTIDLQA
ncbi:hypothetical protein SNE40_013897 [Patella caerulea]